MSAKDHPDIDRQAARWYLRLSEQGGGSRDVEPFELWLSGGEAHAVAYRRVVATMSKVDQAAEFEPLVSFVQDAKGRLIAPRIQVGKMAFAAGLVAMFLAAGGLLYLEQFRTVRHQFATAVGERRQIMLEDGSHLTLDSRSAVDVTFFVKARRLNLVRGQARFKVAHDATRPFSVAVAGRQVVAIGTDFTVERLADRTIVTLLRGGVNVEPKEEGGILGRLWPQSQSGQSVRLRPGRQLVIADTGTARMTYVNTTNVVSWESGILTFEDEPLASACERFNRSNPIRLALADRRLGTVKVSGTFAANDPAVFAMAVAQMFGLSLTKKSANILYLTGYPMRLPR